MNLNDNIETERMKLRYLNSNDIDVIYRQFSDTDMCKYFSESPCDMEEAKGIIEHYQKPEGKNELRYGMFHKQTGDFIGSCGYHYFDKDRKQVEIGYDIWKEYWRKGYASEVLPILINICYEYLGVDCIYILVHPQNKASIKTGRKFGFKECEPCRIPDVEQEICMKLYKNLL